MRDYINFYIDGQWVTPQDREKLEVINPATEQVAGQISMGTAADVDAAVAAAKQAFISFSQFTQQERLELLEAICAAYKSKSADIAAAITEEMGAPKWLSESNQAASGYMHFKSAMQVLKDYEFEFKQDSTTIRKEPVGVCGFITPWNWPVNQIGCKLAPALATGCTVVWKPSEVAPLSAYLLMQVLHEAGVPPGVVNMINGDGPAVGSAISAHPDIQMVSFTGSTRAGTAVAQDAAPTIKRVTQELGGKSPNIILADLSAEAFAKAVSGGVKTMCVNSGQNCNAPSRMLVPEERLAEAEEVIKNTLSKVSVGAPNDEGVFAGPVVSEVQWQKIQDLIQAGIDEGAELLVGGVGKPEGLEQGYYVKPTVFSRVNNDMKIAREEIFGPVLCLLSYQDEAEAIAIANDTDYGLSGYVSGADAQHVNAVAKQIRAGMIHINGAQMDRTAPFGGYKHSGNGRERGPQGFDEFLETKAMLGMQ
ncbi:aldehyde dehydrogenase family protein [Marinicella sp. S1101]|uniref:aldehyde dehydrogenase family protein n=1 Tax=Marinicella marina TaxID=2996016 RepID=UPI002260CD30|nr:aldehyde dehydrogenase family protein [Marinicella marina]MCX7552820.1 aldehyde dehydrogenase family protein [Marinicella marina]MDJ1139871.1 aldehyde dehydrogenase family protein [Marinicella marina]